MTKRDERRIPAYLGRVLTGETAVGTCFQLAPGLIATAWHVLEKNLGVGGCGEQVTAGPLEPRVGEPFTATVKAFDAPNDLAILQTDRDLGGSIAVLSPSDTISPHAKLLVTGVSVLDDPGAEHEYWDAFGDPGGRGSRGGVS